MPYEKMQADDIALEFDHHVIVDVRDGTIHRRGDQSLMGAMVELTKELGRPFFDALSEEDRTDVIETAKRYTRTLIAMGADWEDEEFLVDRVVSFGPFQARGGTKDAKNVTLALRRFQGLAPLADPDPRSNDNQLARWLEKNYFEPTENEISGVTPYDAEYELEDKRSGMSGMPGFPGLAPDMPTGLKRALEEMLGRSGVPMSSMSMGAGTGIIAIGADELREFLSSRPEKRSEDSGDSASIPLSELETEDGRSKLRAALERAVRSMGRGGGSAE